MRTKIVQKFKQHRSLKKTLSSNESLTLKKTRKHLELVIFQTFHFWVNNRKTADYENNTKVTCSDSNH